MSSGVPILFCVFNRPDHTRRVLQAIATWRPQRLLVVGDGPRPHVRGETEAVMAVRQLIETVDWPCEVRTNYAPANMGCRARIASGIDWGFTQSERLIIVEDDCLPHDDFFPFCETLLERYAEDPRVAAVAGCNFQPCRRTQHGYYFSRYAHIWGWATWRRAWSFYDVDITDWPQLASEGILETVLDDPEEIRYWKRLLDACHAGPCSTWDLQWQFACWRQRALTALPDQNLVSNIGFGHDALHTTDAASPLAALATGALGPITHPAAVAALAEADACTWKTVFAPKPRRGRLSRRLLGLREGAAGLHRRLTHLFGHPRLQGTP